MDKVIVEQDLLRILFPPKGDVPLEKLDSIKTIRYYLGLAIDLAGGQEKKRAIISRADNDALNREIVKQRQAGIRWKDIAKNTGMSDAAVRKRYRRAVEGSSPPGGPADAQAEPQEPATQAPEGPAKELFIDPDPRASCPNALPEPPLIYDPPEDFKSGDHQPGAMVQAKMVLEPPAEFSPIKANVQHVGDGLPDLQPPSAIPSATDTPGQHPPTIRELEAVEAPVQPLSASSPGGPADAQAEPQEPATQAPEGPAEPKIPHSYDERIQQLSREGCGRKFILKALRQEGITGISMRDVDARIKELAKKKQSREEIIQSLSPADQDILNLVDKDRGALISEICVLVARKHHENLTSTQMIRRIADIRVKLRGAK